MRQFHVGHKTQRIHRSGQEFEPVNHELRVDHAHAANAIVPRSSGFHVPPGRRQRYLPGHRCRTIVFSATHGSG